MKPTLLKYDGWHMAMVLGILAPGQRPGDRLTWRIVCGEDGQQNDTEKRIVLYPLPCEELTALPDSITNLISVFRSLNFAAILCARAVNPEAESKALAVLSADVADLTGHTLPDDKLAAVLRLVRDELAIDGLGHPLGQRCNGLDHDRLVKLVEAVATVTGESVNSIRRKMLAGYDPALAQRDDTDRINFLAVFGASPKQVVVPVERYEIGEAWRADSHPGQVAFDFDNRFSELAAGQRESNAQLEKSLDARVDSVAKQIEKLGTKIEAAPPKRRVTFEMGYRKVLFDGEQIDSFKAGGILTLLRLLDDARQTPNNPWLKWEKLVTDSGFTNSQAKTDPYEVFKHGNHRITYETILLTDYRTEAGVKTLYVRLND